MGYSQKITMYAQYCPVIAMLMTCIILGKEKTIHHRILRYPMFRQNHFDPCWGMLNEKCTPTHHQHEHRPFAWLTCESVILPLLKRYCWGRKLLNIVKRFIYVWIADRGHDVSCPQIYAHATAVTQYQPQFLRLQFSESSYELCWVISAITMVKS